MSASPVHKHEHTMGKLIIQIPCFNEESTLPETIADLPTEVPGFAEVEWLIIDDGSTDRTVEVAHELGVHHVVSHPRNRGLAAAFLTGLDTALRAGADVIVNTDADNQYDASCIPELTAPTFEGYDMVVGARPIEDVPEFSRLKKRLQRLGSWVVRKFSGTSVDDAASGFRAMSRTAALRLQVFGRYSYTMETIVQARAEGLSVASVPVRVNPQTRPSRLVKSAGQYVWRSGQTIVRSFAIYYPFRFFFLVGMLPFLVGFVLLGRWVFHFFTDDVYSPRLPSLLVGAVCTLVGFQLWAVGFLGDLQAASRKLLAEARVREREAAIEAGRGAADAEAARS